MNSQFNKKELLSENTSFSAKFNNSPFEGPLIINELAGPFNTTFGLTHCPGRSSKHSKSNLWNRDLLEDFMEIQNWGADVLISLIASQEFVQLGVPEFPEVANRQKFDWYHLPIQDFHAPGSKFQEAWNRDGETILKYVTTGSKIMIHCAAGLGRTGTFAAKILTNFGWDPRTAIKEVRRIRPGAIERKIQEQYILNDTPL